MKFDKIGAVLPIKEEHVEGLFRKGRDVFIKFSNLILEPKEKILFYMSRKGKLIGEATIIVVKEMDAESVWALYGNRIFLERKEFERYIKTSPITGEKRKGKLKVFLLGNKQRYPRALESSFVVTAAGRYLTEDMFEEVLKQLEG